MPISNVLLLGGCRGGVEQTQQQPLCQTLEEGQEKKYTESPILQLFREPGSQGGERALKRAFVEGEKSSRQFCMLSCNRIMEQSKLNQFCNDWGDFPLMAAAPESREGSRGWSRGAETHREHPWMVAWDPRAACRVGQDFPGAACVTMAMRNPRGINESGAHRESFGVEKGSAWPGRAGRWRRAGGRVGGAGIPAA